VYVIVCVEMGPYYEGLCAELKWPVDSILLETMRQKNADRLSRITAQIEDAEQNLGEIEIKDAYIARAEYLAQIGDKVNMR
jgi:26S proteasome regulatory subunit N7